MTVDTAAVLAKRPFGGRHPKSTNVSEWADYADELEAALRARAIELDDLRAKAQAATAAVERYRELEKAIRDAVGAHRGRIYGPTLRQSNAIDSALAALDSEATS